MTALGETTGPTILTDPAPYAPFLDPRIARPPGLMPLDPVEWVVRHDDFAAQMAYRERLMAERPDIVHALLPEGREAASELLDMLLTHLAQSPGYLPGGEAAAGETMRRPDGATAGIDRVRPLMTIGRLVADDFCVLIPDAASGEYRLVGAILCFPSRWSLAEKTGRPLTAIHDPVPDYDGTMARRVNRVFEALRPGRPLWRINWLVHPTPELHRPVLVSEKGRPEPWLDGFWLRTERQTLTRLPLTGGVAFGIKTSITPVEALSPEVAAGLADAMEALDAGTVAYRAGGGIAAAATRRLRQIAGQAPGAFASNWKR